MALTQDTTDAVIVATRKMPVAQVLKTHQNRLASPVGAEQLFAISSHNVDIYRDVKSAVIWVCESEGWRIFPPLRCLSGCVGKRFVEVIARGRQTADFPHVKQLCDSSLAGPAATT